VPIEKGLKKLHPGQILHCVISRNTSNEYRRMIAASVGVAIPKDRNHHGYLSEHHSFGETDKQAGDYAEDLAALMLSTTLGLDFDNDTTWDQKEEIWKMSGKIVKTTNVTQSAVCTNGVWTTVIAAAVFVR
jgi:arginine decarboxylase